MVQEQLAQLAQRERESAASTGIDEMTPALIIEKGRAHEEHEKAKKLVSDDFLATYDISLSRISL